MLDDLLAPDLELVVCGSAPGHRSARLRQYYAGPGNRFWLTLAEVGLTPRRLAPSEYRSLLDFGIGLTDLARGQSGGDRELDFSPADRTALRRKIRRLRPRLLCFNGKRAAREFLGARELGYGLQPAAIGDTRLFVAPSTSGAAKQSFDLSVWRDLSRLVRARGFPPDPDARGGSWARGGRSATRG
jgi:TDG/mug DNA glycosylase family protein